ncbi:hypothetical protein EW026_g1466 [Hermanssonia centrifuga]|uniref:Uncharacterized protein n=1 Tax=Hermanssonia centrifuga TaxID=98765 RepID=A0A4S4KRC7_9APHY|nr:hypothetical protein EW026_g1466 [Hermanssonia centrifuga]
MQDINLTDSETFIALLLQEDLRIIGETLEAEMLQLEQVLSDSALASARTPEQVERSLTVSDVEVALAIAAAEAQTVLDAACAQDLKHSHDASLLLSQQFAQKLHATEKKFTLDAEFAKKLDEINRNGDANTDDPRFQDADK